MSKNITLEILDYESTGNISSALQDWGLFSGSNATNGSLTASPVTTPEERALRSNFALNDEWTGWYADGGGSYFSSTGAPSIVGNKLKLPTATASASYSFEQSACGVYLMLENLNVGEDYNITVKISQIPTTQNFAMETLIVGKAQPNHYYVTQTNGVVVPPAFGQDREVYYLTGVHTDVFTAAHKSGYFSISGYGNAAGHWLVDYVSITPVSSPTTIKEKTIGTLDITDSETFPLALSYTVSDGKDLESRFGDFSKTFDLPATKNNNKILNHIYNPLTQDHKNITGVKDCRIMVDGIPFFKGQIQIKGNTQTAKPEAYSATIYGGNFSWISLLRDKRVCDIEYSNTVHTYDYANIQSSWTTTQATSDVVYPLVSYGDFYPNGTAGTVNLWDEDNVEQDWRGWFWVYNMIEKIFTNIGYTVSSNLLETANFKKLITHFDWLNKGEDIDVLKSTYACEVEYTRGRDGSTHPIAPATVSYAQYWAQSGGTWLNLSGGFSSQFIDIIYDDAIHNPLNAYNTSTGEWTCPKSGYYKISASINVMTNYNTSYFNNATSWNFFSKYHLRKSGTNISTAWVTNGSGQSHFFGAQNFGDGMKQGFGGITAQTNGFEYFNAGEVVDTRVEGYGAEGTGTTPQVAFTALGRGNNGYNMNVGTLWNPPTVKFQVEYDPEQVAIGDEFLPQEMMPCDITQIDFIKAIAHLFNLYFTTDVQSRIVYIEPFNDFFTHTDAVDWTQKIDFSKKIQDKYDIGLTQEVLFKYKEDSSDKYVEYLNEDENGRKLRNPLYSYYETLGSNYKKGVTEFENPLFSPTQQTWDNDCTNLTNSPLIPVIWGDVPPSLTVGFESVATSPIDRPDKIYDNEPRIAYYHGYVANPNDSNYVTKWNKALGASSITYGVQETPRATFVDWEDITFPSLSYSDELVSPPFSTTESNVKGLYTTYWKNMIDQLKASPRIRNVYINLHIKDILNLDMRKLVYLDGSWWRINKIVDFSPAKNETTKVELIQWLEV
jgi:hypothetical protein